METGVELAVRVAEKVAVNAMLVDNGSNAETPTLWPSYLSSGHLGPAILYAQLHQMLGGEVWRNRMHASLGEAIRSPKVHAGLYNGLGGLLLAALSCRAKGASYRSLIEALETGCIQQFEGLASAALARGEDIRSVDIINGLSGLFIVLEHSARRLDAQRTFGTFLRQYASRGVLRRVLAGKSVDCGLSHGISGLLLAGALVEDDSTRRSVIVPLVEFLLSHQVEQRSYPQWPSFVDGGEPRFSRVAWCYGSPGTSVALAVAGAREPSLIDTATILRPLRALDSLPFDAWHADDETLCHGRLGIALCCQYVSAACGRDPIVDGVADHITRRAAAQFDDRLTFGFATVDHLGAVYGSAGFLMGASGCALALLAIARNDRPFWPIALGLV